MAEKKEKEPMRFLEKLSAIQTKIKAPKNLWNKYSEFYYRNAEGILEAVKPYLAEYNLILVLKDEIVLIGERYYVKATATLTDAETDASYEVSAYAREVNEKKGMDGSQITGATSSYARKYALNGLFLLDDTKDADTDEFHKQTEQKKDTPEKELKAELKDLWAKAGGPKDGFEEWYKSKTTDGFSTQAYATMKASLMAQINKKAEEKK